MQGAKLHPQQRRRSSPMRRARQPSAGFPPRTPSCRAARLSPPMSSVRKVTGSVAGGVEHGAIERLSGRPGRGKRDGEHELQFGAEEADRLRAGLRRDAAGRREVRRSCAAPIVDAVDGDGRRVAQRAILRLALARAARLFGIGRLDVRAAAADGPRRSRRRR